MNSLVLSEKQILTISDFVGKVSSIPMVEGVYILAYIGDNNLEYIEINTINNCSLYYNGKLTGKEQTRSDEEQEERKQLKSIIERFKEQFEKENLSFNVISSSNYSLKLLNRREVIAGRSLANGTILFDRFDDVEKKKIEALNQLPLYDNTLSIENIDEVKNKLQPNTLKLIMDEKNN